VRQTRSDADTPRLADVVIRAGAIYSMAEDRAIYRAIALRDERIVAIAADPHGLDGLISAGTRVVDDAGLTLVPAFYDTHNHLMEFVRNVALVPVGQARNVAEFVELIRRRAAKTPPGQWIQTSNAWHEQNLVERRMPSLGELDAATREHPVVARRGGHVALVNSVGLRLAGITRETPDPPGGRIGHTPDGSPNGILEGGARLPLMRLVPPLPFEEQVASMGEATRAFAAVGLGAVRDPVVMRDELPLYQAAWERGGLAVRCRPMFLSSPMGAVADRIAQIAGYAMRSGFGDDWLRVWGLKVILDGGAEGGALDQPYADDPKEFGHLNWDPDELFQVANAAVKRGWRIGTHVVGDRGLRTLLDVYERVARETPGLPAGTLVIEHGFLADGEQRARAIALGVWVTVQPPLLYALGGELARRWGAARTRNVMPVRAWLEEGAQLSGGTDYPIGAYDPLRSIHGFATRATEKAGVQGPEYAIDRYTAIALYTVGGARLDRELDRRGTLGPGKLADLVASRADPLTCPVDDLLTLRPSLTVVGGRAAFDPEGLLGERG